MVQIIFFMKFILNLFHMTSRKEKAAAFEVSIWLLLFQTHDMSREGHMLLIPSAAHCADYHANPSNTINTVPVVSRSFGRLISV